jgi:hypothetical protein
MLPTPKMGLGIAFGAPECFECKQSKNEIARYFVIEAMLAVSAFTSIIHDVKG